MGLDRDGHPSGARGVTLNRPISGEWLALRGAADDQARQASAGLLERLDDHLAAAPTARHGVFVVDLGAGTGANLLWLAPRLRAPQHWILVDHDAELLSQAARHQPPPGVASVRVWVSGLDGLNGVIAELPSAPPRLLTCAALLDLLDHAELRRLAGTVRDSGAAALFSLSVSGEIAFDPAHPSDELMGTAFDAHQRRDGLAGPSGGDLMASELRARGLTVSTEETPWRLGPGQAALLRVFLSDRVQAVLEADPRLRAVADEWLSVRTTQIDHAGLSLTVGHLDVLALPPPG